MRIAVIGAGVSGLAAAWSLAARHEVTVFEGAPRLGGHACTVTVEAAGKTFPVDLGFLVYNERNYPGFSRLLKHLEVETAPSSMSLSIEDPASGRTVSGASVWALLRSTGGLLTPRSWKLLTNQFRWARAARAEFSRGGPPADETLAGFSRRIALADSFVQGYLQPLAGAIWSMPPQEVQGFPARALLEFLDQHGLVGLLDRPQWRTIRGGSREYVQRWASRIPARWRVGTAAERIRRPPSGGVEVRAGGEWLSFDRAIVAVHTDQALDLLELPRPEEVEILSSVRYRESDVVLHTDRSLLPRRRSLWASWNVQTSAAGSGGVAITYLIDELQPVPVSGPWCVTLNGLDRIDPNQILHRTRMAHPQIDAAAVSARHRWHELLPENPVLYAGAYWGHGFHEDGFDSGLRAARALEEGTGLAWA